MFPLRDVLIRVVLLYSLCGFVQFAHAVIKGAPLPGGPCLASNSTLTSNVCVPVNRLMSAWTSQGMAYWPAGQSLDSSNNNFQLTAYALAAYVPVTGMYKMRAYWCASVQNPEGSSEACQRSKAVSFVDTRFAKRLNAEQEITSQNPSFGGGDGGVLAQGGNMCLVFVDEAGNEYKAESALYCQDASVLPDTPNSCNINGAISLNVDMGTLERKDIVAWPTRSPTKVSKTIPIICSGDSSISADIKFDFSEMLVNGGTKSTAIKTSTPGLGIVVSYNDHVMQGSSDKVTETFSPGVTGVKLEFEAVRDPTSKNIATGAFSANAIMIITQH